MLKIFKGAFSGFSRDECGNRAAALAYYTIFALPPLLILLVTIAGKVFGPEKVQRSLETQFAGIVGQSGGQQIHQMMTHGMNTPGGGVFAMVASIVGLLLGATGAFLSLQEALNHAWEVKPDPKQGGIWNFISKRLLSLGMVFGLGFLLAVSLALTAAVSALSGAIGGGLAPVLLKVVDVVVSVGILTLLFAALFKFLPDAKVAWRDLWVGGFATAVLFVVGKFVIGLYLGHSKPGDAFGAASALAVVLVWVYYAGLIILFGAEFTQEWATERGSGMEPREGAVRVIQREETVDDAGPKAVAATDSAPGARPAAAPGGGGFGDWLLGLPVLYLIFKRRPSTDRRR